jgi:hypothetical protein
MAKTKKVGKDLSIIRKELEPTLIKYYEYCVEHPLECYGTVPLSNPEDIPPVNAGQFVAGPNKIDPVGNVLGHGDGWNIKANPAYNILDKNQKAQIAVAQLEHQIELQKKMLDMAKEKI